MFVDTEVPAKSQRRRFTADYKLQILTEAAGCRDAGSVGALLRREGLYSSHLAAWRASKEKGGLEALTKKPGRKMKETAEAKEIRRLRRENAELRAKLRRTETIIEVQKKVSEILGVDLNPPANEESE